MRLDQSQYLILVAFAYETGDTLGSVSGTGYRIVECISQFASIIQNPARNHSFNIRHLAESTQDTYSLIVPRTVWPVFREEAIARVPLRPLWWN